MSKQNSPLNREMEPTKYLPPGYMQFGSATLAFCEKTKQWVWPGGKRISCPSQARLNCEYLDSIISGEVPAVFNESGYVTL